MADGRRLTAQGSERKQQLLDCAADAVRRRGYADTRVIDICAPPAWPRASSTGTSRTRKRCSRELVDEHPPAAARAQADAIDPDGRPARAPPPGRGGVGAVHGDPRPVLRAARGRERTSVRRRAAQGHRGPRRRRGRPDPGRHRRRLDPRRDPDPAGRGWSASSATYSHFHRTGRTTSPSTSSRRSSAGSSSALAADDEIALLRDAKLPCQTAVAPAAAASVPPQLHRHKKEFARAPQVPERRVARRGEGHPREVRRPRARSRKIKMNQIITGVPFGDGEHQALHGHLVGRHRDGEGPARRRRRHRHHRLRRRPARSSSTRTRRPGCRRSCPARSRCRAT